MCVGGDTISHVFADSNFSDPNWTWQSATFVGGGLPMCARSYAAFYGLNWHAFHEQLQKAQEMLPFDRLNMIHVPKLMEHPQNRREPIINSSSHHTSLCDVFSSHLAALMSFVPA